MIHPALALLAVLALAPTAPAHVGEPTIKRLRFPPARAGEAWLLVDNVGLLALTAGRWRWLCDEAITAEPGFNDLAPLDAEGRIWIAATRGGLYRTRDAGCTFTPVEGTALDYYDFLSPHPDRPGEAIVGTLTIGADANDLYRTTDAGLTWTPAGLALDGRVRGLLRATADPAVIYLGHTHGAMRSDDGGQTFTPIALAPPADPDTRPATGTDVALLATDPHDARVIWSALVRFPESDLQRSRDGGATWERVARFTDTPQSLAIDAATGALTLAMPLEGLHRSTDDGASWEPLFLPDPGAWFDCLTHAPDGGLWACARRGAPYLVARMGDGDDWIGRFAADYTDIAGRWQCPAESHSARICAAACDRSREDCSGVDGGASADGGLPDSGLADAAETDTGAEAEAGAEVPVSRPPADCRAAPGVFEADAPRLPMHRLGLVLAVLLGLVFVPARASRRACRDLP